jgi:protein-tyrosine phosphatase
MNLSTAGWSSARPSLGLDKVTRRGALFQALTRSRKAIPNTLGAALIDLHAHILPGMDDGAADLETSVAMCKTAVADGIRTMAATPHVNRDYPPDPKTMSFAVGTLNVALARMEVPLAVLPGGEVEMATASELDDDTLRAFCLGGGDCLLLESPYGGDLDPAWLDELIASLQERGFRPLLAHPERSPLIQEDAGRLEPLVERGVHCTVNAGSMTGRSGDAARECAVELFHRGLVHAVATDAHDNSRRPPRLREAFDALEPQLEGVSRLREWCTEAAPAAILAGEPLPERPELHPERGGRFRRIFSRSQDLTR